MSKSNKEKSRLNAIKKFKNGELEFSPDLLKVKLKFIHVISKSNLGKILIKNRTTKINNFIKNKYKETIIRMLLALAEKHQIFDFSVNLILISMSTSYNKFFIDVFVNKIFFCNITAKNNYKIPVEDINFRLNLFLDKNYIEFKSIFKLFSFKKDVLISNSRCYKRLVNKRNSLHDSFKNDLFYNRIKKYIEYIIDNNNVFKIPVFGTTYDFIDNVFSEVYCYDGDGERYSVKNQATFENNLDILKCLKLMNFLKFDIDGLSEMDILEMYELLNY